VRIVSRAVTVTIVAVVLGVGWLWLRGHVGRPTVAGHHHTYALFRDASGLPVGSRVLIAGVQVGEIDHLTIEGELARVDMRLSDRVVLWDDAYASKTGSAVFGDAHVEIVPGGPDDPSQGDGRHRRLRDGERIPRVIEGDSTDRLLRTVDNALPPIEGGLDATDRWVTTSRRWFDGYAERRLADVDRYLADNTVVPQLDRADRALTRFDAWSRTALATTRRVAPTVDGKLDAAAAALARITTQMRDAQGALHDQLASARTQLDDVDPYLARANAWLVRQGGDVTEVAGSGAGSGTAPERSRFGRLVDDPKLGEKIADTVQDVADYTYTLDRIRTVIGLRNEFSLRAGSLQAYLTMELSGRSDRFFLIELERGSIGRLADIQIHDTPGGGYVRTADIVGGFRLSAQWGKRFGPFDVRFGLKESTFGAGADAIFFRGRLRFAADLYGKNFSNVPRLKLDAELEALPSVFVFGGIDDALSTPGYLRIAPWPVAQTSPTDFRTLSYGRDYILGFTFRLDEEDAARMLRLYGAFVGAFL
jgi:phospholipid/cholesterol/gamma-HCH transport system substrate-binding protein